MKTNHKKIILATQYCEFAGAPMLALNIGKELKRRGYKLFIICSGYGDLYSQMIHIAPTALIKNGPFLYLLTRLLGLCGYKKVLTNTTMGGYIVPYAKRSGMKVVSLIHELPGVILANQVKEVAKDIVKYADKIIFPNNYVKDRYVNHALLKSSQTCIRGQGLYKELHKVSPKKIEKIKKQYQIPDKNKVFIGIGMGFKKKGTDLFINIAKNIVQAKDDVSFVWIGASLEEDKRIIRAGKKAGVIFIPSTNDIAAFYQMADLFFMTSREDSFPSVVLEAIYYGLPVIGFHDGGGFCELPEEYVSLVPFEDTRAFSEKALQLLEDIDLLQKVKQDGERFILENYNFQNYVTYLIDLMFGVGKD